MTKKKKVKQREHAHIDVQGATVDRESDNEHDAEHARGESTVTGVSVTTASDDGTVDPNARQITVSFVLPDDAEFKEPWSARLKCAEFASISVVICFGEIG